MGAPRTCLETIKFGKRAGHASPGWRIVAINISVFKRGGLVVYPADENAVKRSNARARAHVFDAITIPRPSLPADLC